MHIQLASLHCMLLCKVYCACLMRLCTALCTCLHLRLYGQHNSHPAGLSTACNRYVSGTPSSVTASCLDTDQALGAACNCCCRHCRLHQRRLHFSDRLLKLGTPITDHCLQVLLPIVIYTAGPISGAHFNPMVTSVFVATRMLVSPFWTGLHLSWTGLLPA